MGQGEDREEEVSRVQHFEKTLCFMFRIHITRLDTCVNVCLLHLWQNFLLLTAPRKSWSHMF